MNTCTVNTMQTTENIPISITYNVNNMGVGRMEKKQTNTTVLKASNQSAFNTLIKVGIYKSMCSENLISQAQLKRLIENQKEGDKVCL